MCLGWFEPTATKGTTKFGGAGLCSSNSKVFDDLPERAKNTMKELGNFGLSQKTWGSYRTAQKMWTLCQDQTGSALPLPWSQRETIIFIDWLVNDRKVKSATINTYLAGIKKVHILQGFDEPKLKTTLIKQLIKGKHNMELNKRYLTDDHGRLPVTITTLKLIKEKLRQSDRNIENKLLIWSVATIAFFGGVRIHEILSQTESSYDPNFTLLEQNIRVTEYKNGTETTKVLEVLIKCPKESKTGKDVVLDIFEIAGGLCPIKAFTRWRSKSATTGRGGPAFREEDGTPLTGRKFNAYLKELLSDIVDYKKEKITSHSFRAGLATLLATNGVSIGEIKIAGRWNSRSYEKYVKLPRAQRSLLAQKLGSIVN